MNDRIKLLYATKSQFKQNEIRKVLQSSDIHDRYGASVAASDHFEVDFPDAKTNEPLERDLEVMVRHKAVSAYRTVMSPCIVEHAGLIVDEYAGQSYPGGLTQPMWDALTPEDFLKSISWTAGRIVARAVVGYCDGMSVKVFTGETSGELSKSPLGKREFYWDTVFIPDGGEGKTYAEIAGGPDGLEKKVLLSQSRKAMLKCLEYMLRQDPAMFPRV